VRPRHTLTRRQMMVAASGAMALSSCARRPLSTPPIVSIARHPAYDQTLYDSVRRLLVAHKLSIRGKRVVLKPNLVEFDSATTINTHPLLVHAALEAFRSLDAADVRIAEGPGHRRITLDLAEAAGYFQTVPSFDGVFTDLNLDEITPVRLKRTFSRLRTVYFPNTVLGCDLLVSMPKMKTHHWVGATLSMKNLFGLLPGAVYGWPKNILHWAGINESIADLYNAFPNTFAIVDGIEGMQGNGPIQGSPKHAGVLVAGKNLPAVDATCCRIMGIDPMKIGYLRLSAQADALAETRLQQAGASIAEVRTDFQLLPEFQSIRLGGA
jgi:uncharacterized protein (DUF362 family)